ncbi:hypothetical protein OG389_07610 [Streptomyces sp. NBC_00435]|uniref:hypothetical protein n=1 Tax=Streptomyces sp. NBC_00435 TaxID=2903649 RepID=UPI002E1ED95D
MTGTRPTVFVHAPDARGLRPVTLGGRPLGSVWSSRELERLLRRAGYTESGDSGPGPVHWEGGGAADWPDEPLPRRLTAAVMVAGLLGCAVLLGVIGQVDAARSATFAGRLTGFLLLLAGLAQVAAALAAHDFLGKRRWPYSGVPVLAGAFIALIMTTLLLGMWLEEREFVALLPVYGLLWCWSVWALCILLRRRAWSGMRYPKSVVAGLTLSGVLAVTNFSYAALYTPNAARAQLITTAAVGKPTVSRDGTVLYVPVTVSVKNTGTVAVNIAGSAYWVTGASSVPTTSVVPDYWRKAKERDVDGDAEGYSLPVPPTLLATGPVGVEGSWLDPGSEHAEEKIIQLRRGAGQPEYTVVEAVSQVISVRQDRARIRPGLKEPSFSWRAGKAPAATCLASMDDCVLFRARVDHNNNLVNVTRGPRYLSVWSYQEGPDGAGADIKAVITPLDSRGNLVDHQEPGDRYGFASETSRVSRVVIGPLAAPQAPRTADDPAPTGPPEEEDG